MTTVSEAKQKIANGEYDGDEITTEVVNRLLVAECNYFNPPITPMDVHQAIIIHEAWPEMFVEPMDDGDRWDGLS